ncbi:bifunctional methylenetetrahydrofolate dehydrogenase/methenyltetrahydrofolate cyclohydrolase FolD [Candidatus Undinarchaeota archaeon]
MTAKLIDGKTISQEVIDDLKNQISKFDKKPGLALVLVGEDPASKIYTACKEKRCVEIGIKSVMYRLPAETSQEELNNLIDKLNSDENVHGTIVQLPLPEQLDPVEVSYKIDSKKDVDGFTPENMGKLLRGEDCLVPCTPQGIVYMLKKSGIEIHGKKVSVVGRSNIVGKPVSILLLNEHATVTTCHSKTKDLCAETKDADILVAAVGKAGLITADMVKDGAAVIDVGMNRVDGKLMGDVDFESVKEKAGWITPVPGGVGLMTVAMLMKNTVEAYKKLEGV